MTDMKKLSEFTKRNARLDLKVVALEYILGLSGSDEGIDLFIKNPDVVLDLLYLVEDNNEVIQKDTLLFLVNFTAKKEGINLLFDLHDCGKIHVFSVIINCILNCDYKNADAACMVLSNMTRCEEVVEKCVTEILPYLPKLLDAFINLEFNKNGAKLDYIGPILSNLSCSRRVTDWLVKDPTMPLLKILPFCHYKSLIRRGGAIGTIRNVCFHNDLHQVLLSDEVNLLTYLLQPLIGNEDYDDDEMETFPLDLQYMPEDKVREEDSDLRRMLLETLNRLCVKRDGRDLLRKNGVYYILRELHKWEKNKAVLLACENVVDILIRKESEIEVEDISSLEVPSDLNEKFQKMDEDFIKN